MGGYPFGHHPLPTAIRRRLIQVVTACLAVLAVAGPGMAGTYRWVDEQGRVHYGDSIPPQYAGRGHTELNAQGRVIKRVDKAQSGEAARKEREAEARRKAEEARVERESQRRDNALLATYSRVEELDLARKRALDQEQSLLTTLESLRKSSASTAEIKYLDSLIKMRQASLASLKAKFDADRARYLELTAHRP